MLPKLQEFVGRLSSARKAALLLGVAALLWMAGTVAGFLIQPQQALLMSSLGIVICLFGGISGLLIGDLLPGDDHALNRMLLGMLLRMGIPLAMIVTIFLGAPKLLDGGLPFYILVYYMPLLALETILSLPQPMNLPPVDMPSINMREQR